ncbi:signal peptidase II [Buchnera aphidicola]|uniref:signal peptidase II n=1 Tax=Buchnera aphidicola TaxID=9 RepID=UPI003BEEC540
MKNENFYNIKKNKYICIIVIIVLIDLYSKHWITKNFYLYEQKKIFSILNIFYVHNYGVAFSLLSNQNGWQKWLLSSISIITILSIIYIIVTSSQKNNIIPYYFIIGGAIGNLFDRILHQYVIDFIDFHIHNYHFATFNIADLSIFFGILIIIKNTLIRKI